MTPEPSRTADKFIVDRTRPHRNSNVDRTVRLTRDRLSEKAGTPDFNRDMLQLHARSVLKNAVALPLLVIVLCLAGFAIGAGAEAPGWALATTLLYAPLYLMARRTDRLSRNEIEAERTRRGFFLAHFVSGLGWAYFAFLGCTECGATQLPVFQAVVLLAVLAGTAMISASLGGALVAAFALPVCIFAFRAASQHDPAQIAMAILVSISLPFFAYVAQQRARSALTLLAFEREKDGLIGELETAKALSDEARRRAEEANLAKSRFLASMSHELRTPLNAILGFSEVMAGEVLGPLANPTYRDYAKDIHASGKHLLELINEILDLSRIEAGRYQLNEEPLMLGDVIEESCRLIELKTQAKNIRLSLQVEPTLLRLFADERAIRQIALNLLSNAVKFTPSGGEISIRVGWTAGGGQYVAIKDNGPGIAEDELPVVLAAFGQGAIAIKSAEQGTGLGLPIVQGLTDLHGGVFELKSKLRAGTEAIVAFPRSRVMEELPAIPQERKSAAAGRI
ncbi:histidine kinase sensor protein [Nitratireductor indicus C115]|uniref:histidine kinase n=1 Tax=Nitratireductor indicus C115 TaxID=1231190 RepID=K2N8L8_9HYPH|nr:HAMP domain-containing sensor histidine kinase [Nitratireductor indicus]EKF43843.1 histidine kinase sensor protein [Nitratireductor indicus C115]SFQ15752.1 two-component system, cell cycle sensor histidine kinase PleC [Nitratireductor indicus]